MEHPAATCSDAHFRGRASSCGSRRATPSGSTNRSRCNSRAASPSPTDTLALEDIGGPLTQKPRYLKYSRDLEADFCSKIDDDPNPGCLSLTRGEINGGHKTLALFIVFLTNTLDWCLISVLIPAAPGYLSLDTSDKGAISQLGIVIGANAGTQLLTSMVAGRFVDRYGSTLPFSLGLFTMLCSTFVLAFAGDLSWDHRYAIVLVCRCIQGASSGLAATAGMAWLLSLFDDEEKRSRAIGLAVTGVGLGIIIGMPLGSAFTSLGIKPGWRIPFLILDGLLLLNIGLLFYCLGAKLPQVKRIDDGLGWSVVLRLATDPYIFLLFMLGCVLNIGMAAIESTLPAWLRMVLDAPSWSLGVFFMACHIPYTIVAPLSGQIFLKAGRHWAIFLGNFLMGFGMFTIPTVIYLSHRYQASPVYVTLPLILTGCGLGMFDAVSMPFAAIIVAKRHGNLLGSACAIINASWSTGFFVGPIVINLAVDAFGYQWVYVVVGQVILLTSFSAFSLRHIPDSASKPLVQT